MSTIPTPSADPAFWRKCSSCKKPIAYQRLYWVCNVSTCTRKRTGLVFCEVSCWDAHVPQMNHRESWAEERKAPTFEEWDKTLKGEDEPKKRKPRVVEEEKPAEAAKAAGPARVILRRTTGT